MIKPEDFGSDNIQMATPHLDISRTVAMANEISEMMEEHARIEAEERALILDGALAQIDAAEDLAEIKGHMQDVIDNQQRQIERQERTIDQLQELNDAQTRQIENLNMLFYSLEDGTAVSKEMMKQLEELLSQQPDWKDFIKEKGADVAIRTFLTALPALPKMIGIVP